MNAPEKDSVSLGGNNQKFVRVFDASPTKGVKEPVKDVRGPLGRINHPDPSTGDKSGSGRWVYHNGKILKQPVILNSVSNKPEGMMPVTVDSRRPATVVVGEDAKAKQDCVENCGLTETPHVVDKLINLPSNLANKDTPKQEDGKYGPEPSNFNMKNAVENPDKLLSTHPDVDALMQQEKKTVTHHSETSVHMSVEQVSGNGMADKELPEGVSGSISAQFNQMNQDQANLKAQIAATQKALAKLKSDDEEDIEKPTDYSHEAEKAIKSGDADSIEADPYKHLDARSQKEKSEDRMMDLKKEIENESDNGGEDMKQLLEGVTAPKKNVNGQDVEETLENLNKVASKGLLANALGGEKEAASKLAAADNGNDDAESDLTKELIKSIASAEKASDATVQKELFLEAELLALRIKKGVEKKEDREELAGEEIRPDEQASDLFLDRIINKIKKIRSTVGAARGKLMKELNQLVKYLEKVTPVDAALVENGDQPSVSFDEAPATKGSSEESKGEAAPVKSSSSSSSSTEVPDQVRVDTVKPITTSHDTVASPACHARFRQCVKAVQVCHSGCSEDIDLDGCKNKCQEQHDDCQSPCKVEAEEVVKQKCDACQSETKCEVENKCHVTPVIVNDDNTHTTHCTAEVPSTSSSCNAAVTPDVEKDLLKKFLESQMKFNHDIVRELRALKVLHESHVHTGNNKHAIHVRPDEVKPLPLVPHRESSEESSSIEHHSGEVLDADGDVENDDIGRSEHTVKKHKKGGKKSKKHHKKGIDYRKVAEDIISTAVSEASQEMGQAKAKSVKALKEKRARAEEKDDLVDRLQGLLSNLKKDEADTF